MTQINYFNSKDTNYATDTWKWNTIDSSGIFTSSVNNNKTWIDAFSGAAYNRTTTYYRKLGTIADSHFVYKNDSLLYKVLYSYSADGWVVKVQYKNSKNEPLSHKDYTFNITTLETTYKFYADTAQKQQLIETTFDYTGKTVATKYIWNSILASVVKYFYDEAGFYSKIKTEDSTGKLISYETYEYYKPYYFIKKYTTYDSLDSITSYYVYDELGNVTDSLIVPVIFTTQPGAYLNRNNPTISYHNATIVIHSTIAQSLSFRLTNAKGITLHCFNKSIISKGNNLLTLKQPLASGIYFLAGASSHKFFTIRLLVP
jgi:hypothetical protein